jgi:hypothetical protein
MGKNVGSMDRVARLVAASGMLVCSVMAPLPLEARLAFMGLPGAYILFTAISGFCFGYRLTGKNTCRALPKS